MNLDNDFFQVSKSSEYQKKGLHQKWNTFFPRIQVETCVQMHTGVKFLEGMQMKTILKLLGGDTVKLLGGYIPHPSPGFLAPLLVTSKRSFMLEQ